MNPIERELAHVPRWCIVRTIRQQSVAEHAFFVARYAATISTLMGVEPSATMLQYALHHDDEELHSGDIPTPYKRKIRVPETTSILEIMLSEEEVKIVKIADMMEAALFLVDEQLMGNKTVHLILEQLRNELAEACGSLTLKKGGESLAYWCNLQIDAHMHYKGRVA